MGLVHQDREVCGLEDAHLLDVAAAPVEPLANALGRPHVRLRALVHDAHGHGAAETSKTDPAEFLVAENFTQESETPDLRYEARLARAW